MLNYKILLFDLDGTMTDSSPGIFNSIRYALNEMKVPVPDSATLRRFIGPPLTFSFSTYCDLNGDDVNEAIRLYRVYFGDKGLLENSVYEGIPECLESLKNAGYKLGVATSKPEPYALRILDHFDLSKYFDVIAGASMDLTRGTKSDVIRYALAQLGVPEGGDVSDILMIGDREHDVKGAAEFGIDCMGVTFGFGTKEELLEAGAIMIAESPSEIARLLNGC